MATIFANIDTATIVTKHFTEVAHNVVVVVDLNGDADKVIFEIEIGEWAVFKIKESGINNMHSSAHIKAISTNELEKLEFVVIEADDCYTLDYARFSSRGEAMDAHF